MNVGVVGTYVLGFMASFSKSLVHLTAQSQDYIYLEYVRENIYKTFRGICELYLLKTASGAGNTA